MISVPRLYASQCARTAMIDLIAGGITITADEKLNLLGQVQGAFMVGDAILNARWADSKAHRRKLIASITQRMIEIDGIPEYIAPVLSRMVIDEILGTSLCGKCNGTGEVFSRKQNKFNPCKACHGVGQIVPTHDVLLKSLNKGIRANNSDLTVSEQDWTRKYYDKFMDYTDELHSAASDAMQFANFLLKALQQEEAD